MTGWICDSVYDGWFYIDPQTGMKRGWVLVDGKWYYLNEKADGKGGMMLANCLTPDGYYEGRRKLGRHGQPERAIREQPKEMTGKSLLVSEK